MNSFLLHLSIKDRDGGSNGRFLCTVNDTNLELVHMYGAEYKILTTVPFDREQQTNFVASVNCRDFGDPPLYSKEDINVSITDKNDNAPIFSQRSYFATIREKNQIGDFIIEISCTDQDEGRNGVIEFYLLNNSEKILINNTSGIITAAAEFDHEDIANFETSILAKDHGRPSLSASATLFLKILDVNDEPPTFSQNQYTFHIAEKMPPGREVGRIHVTDRDSLPYNTFQLSLIRSIISREASDIFMIDKKTGSIKTTKLLPRSNSTRGFHLVLVATEDAPPHRYTTANITIYMIRDGKTSQTPRPAASPSNDMIIIYALSGALGIMVVIITIVIIICICCKRRQRNNDIFISENLVRTLTKHPDMRKNSLNSYKSSKEWQMVNDFISHPRCLTIDRYGNLSTERVPVGAILPEERQPMYCDNTTVST